MDPQLTPTLPFASRAFVPEEDHDLLLRSASDDGEAFNALFERHRDRLQGFLYRKLGSREEAEDAVSLTFCNAWRARGSFKGHASGKTWLYQIANRVALDMLRRRRRHPPEEELDARPVDSLGAAEESSEPMNAILSAEWTAETQKAVHQAISRLVPEQQRMLTLYYFDGHSHEEIGRMMGLTPSRVKGRLHLIRDRIRRDLVVRQRWGTV
jgi:RNA polymerase sigma-70 factor (ECF subfamily)